MDIRTIELGRINPAPYNPRKDLKPGDPEYERLLRSIERWDMVSPLVWNERSGNLVGGHQRLKILKKRGDADTTVSVVDLGENEEAALNIALNKISGEWDLKRLGDTLSELDASGYDATLTGFDIRELEELLTDPGKDPEEIPEPPANPESVLGEVYKLGPHRLMCGDSTDTKQVAELMDGERADMVFMDPPYAIYGSSSGLSASVTDDKIVRPFFRDALMRCQEVTGFFAQIYVCCDWRSWPSWWEVAKLTALAPKNLIVWDKESPGLGSNWANTYELVGYFVHMPPQKTMAGSRKAGIRQVLKSNIIREGRPTGADRQHNAAKPADLIGNFLDAGSNVGGSVLDLFGGSGSTMIAAEQMGRVCYMMEIDPGYCDVIKMRYAAL